MHGRLVEEKSLMDAAQRFVGSWRLITQYAYDHDGKMTHPRGEDALGFLMYDANGNMMVQLVRQGRYSGDLSNFQTAMSDFLAYHGTYDVDESQESVLHRIVSCSYAAWIGTEQVRRFQFEGDQLTLSAENETEKRILIWQKV
jgi:Lipocalin-like domain